MKSPQAKHEPHFLGAVVLQQVQSPIGEIQERMIIDGQQRLTTLQILFDALHAELRGIDAVVPAGRLEYLIENDKRFCKNGEDRYKVWPTNRDRAAFNGLISEIIDIWGVPPGYKSSTVRDVPHGVQLVDLSDLLSAGLLTAGQTIVPQPLSLRDQVGQVLSDGRIDVNGRVFDTPSGAGHHVRKRSTNGWSFWLVDPQTGKSLASIRREYREKASLESDATDEDDDDDGAGDDVANSPK